MFTATGLTYSGALTLIEKRKEYSIESNITVGGVAVHISPDQLNNAKSICEEMGASFNAGYSIIEETALIKGGHFKHVEQVTNDAISVIQEWEIK